MTPKWTKKIIKCGKIADEPALNKNGYWEKKEKPEIEINAQMDEKKNK